jgi:hypothetical protein
MITRTPALVFINAAASPSPVGEMGDARETVARMLLSVAGFVYQGVHLSDALDNPRISGALANADTILEALDYARLTALAARLTECERERDETRAKRKTFAFPEIKIDWQAINWQQFENSRKALLAKVNTDIEQAPKGAQFSSNWFSSSEMYVIQQVLKAAVNIDAEIAPATARAEAAEAKLAECERELQARKNYTDADYVRLHRAHCMTADELSAATARTEALEKALKPFAELADIWAEDEPNDRRIDDDTCVTLGMCRTARAAIAKEAPNE